MKPKTKTHLNENVPTSFLVVSSIYLPSDVVRMIFARRNMMLVPQRSNLLVVGKAYPTEFPLAYCA
jgi:hypothetical protein